MLEDPAGLPEVGNEGDQAHLATASSTAQGIHFEDTADEPRPGPGGFPAGRAFPGVHEDKFRLLLFPFLPPLFPPIARAVKTVVIGEALIGGRDMGGQKGQKIAHGIAPGLFPGRAEGLPAYGDCVLGPVVPDSFHGQGRPAHVPGHRLDRLAVGAVDTATDMDVEPRVVIPREQQVNDLLPDHPFLQQ